MKKLLLCALTMPLLCQETVHKAPHKDLVITIHEDDVVPQPPSTKPCCRTSDCDIRLKVAIVTATLSFATAVATSALAIYSRQNC